MASSTLLSSCRRAGIAGKLLTWRSFVALAHAVEERVVGARLHGRVAILHRAAAGVVVVRRGAAEARAHAVRVLEDLLAHVLADHAKGDRLLLQGPAVVEVAAGHGAEERGEAQGD